MQNIKNGQAKFEKWSSKTLKTVKQNIKNGQAKCKKWSSKI